jgi:hypothetical protein
MHHLGAALALALASAIQLAACSPRVTSLDENKTLSSLSVDDRRQFCEDQFKYMSSRVPKEDVRKINCAATAGAIGTGDGSDTARARSACQAAYQACLSVPAVEPQSSCETFPTDAQDCAAKVGEATKCVEAQADALAKQASSADDACRDVGRTVGREQSKEDSTVTQDCARVQQLCPKLFSEPTMGTGKPGVAPGAATGEPAGGTHKP